VKPLLHDLFEVNTFWTFAAERATARQNADGTWQVTLHVRGRKSVVDSAGVETLLPIREQVEIGVFGEGVPGDRLSKPLYLRKHDLKPGTSTITFSVPSKPTLAGVDPFHVFDWEQGEEDDNVKSVSIVP